MPWINTLLGTIIVFLSTEKSAISRKSVSKDFYLNFFPKRKVSVYTLIILYPWSRPQLTIQKHNIQFSNQTTPSNTHC